MAKKLTTDLVYPPHLVDNLPSRVKPHGEAECSICLNDGWVNVKGMTREGRGPEYERGATACRWCKVGYRLFHVEQAMGNHLLEPYDLDDIDSPVPPINWRDSAERLRADRAREEGIASLRSLMAASKGRSDELKQGAPSVAVASGTIGGPPRPFATSATSDTVEGAATPQPQEDTDE